MSRNGLYLLIAALLLIVAGLAAYLIYQQSQQPLLEIKVDSKGLEVNTNA